MQKSNTLVVMNYSGATITLYTIPANIQTEQVEEWITENTEHRLSDVHFMTGEDISIIDEQKSLVEEEEQETYSPQEGEKFARKCDVTGEGMNEGYVLEESLLATTIKYESDLIEHLRKLDWEDSNGKKSQDIKDDKELLAFFYNEEYYYYTEWDEEEDAEYIFTNGQLVEI